MLNSFQTLMLGTTAPLLHGDCDKPFVSGFNFMKHWQNLSQDNIEDELWDDIPSLKGRYQASTKCRIRSLVYRYDNKRKTPKIIRQFLSKNGYCRCVLRDTKENEYKTIYRFAHRLIGETFIPNPENKYTINHINLDKQNNEPYNLEWLSYADNNKHAWDNGVFDGNTPLSSDEISDIYNSNLRMNDLKKKYPQVHENTIRRIRGAKGHIKITGAKINKNQKVLDEKIALEIYKSDLTVQEMCKIFGVDSNCIFRIKAGRSFSNITGQKEITKWLGRYRSNEDILAVYSSKLTIKESVKVFKMSFYTIRAIRNGELYSEITKQHQQFKMDWLGEIYAETQAL